MFAREADRARAGRPAAIIAKMNQLEDRPVCEALVEASRADVPIDLIVRGFCVLAPGVISKLMAGLKYPATPRAN